MVKRFFRWLAADRRHSLLEMRVDRVESEMRTLRTEIADQSAKVFTWMKRAQAAERRAGGSVGALGGAGQDVPEGAPPLTPSERIRRQRLERKRRLNGGLPAGLQGASDGRGSVDG